MGAFLQVSHHSELCGPDIFVLTREQVSYYRAMRFAKVPLNLPVPLAILFGTRRDRSPHQTLRLSLF